MWCPVCHDEDTKVVDSRSQQGSIRRRRRCTACGQRFTTYERVERRLPSIRKKDGAVELFSADKVLAGVRIACRKRPIDEVQIEALLSQVEVQLEEIKSTEVSARRVGAVVMDCLRSLDEVAYIRFASVYHEFEDVNQFVDTVRPLVDASCER